MGSHLGDVVEQSDGIFLTERHRSVAIHQEVGPRGVKQHEGAAAREERSRSPCG
jgi:hypothetical protein